MSGKDRGALIVLEGCDRSGKSTQARGLVEWLTAEGRPAELLKFPNRRSPVTGRLIDEYLSSSAELSDEVVHLLFSANRWEEVPRMRSSLEAGTTLVVDRYAHSGVAFSLAKERSTMGLEWCRAPDVGLPAPDLVLFLHLHPLQASQRAGFGQERYEKTAFQAKVNSAFGVLGQAEPGNVWRVVDASRDLPEVTSQVRVLAGEAVKTVRDKPIQKLWT